MRQPPLNSNVIRVRQLSLKSTGFVFVLAAIGFGAAAVNLFYIVHAPNMALTTPALIEVLAGLVVPGLVAAGCALVLFLFPNATRKTLIPLLITCVATCVAILIYGFGLAVAVLVPPTVLLALCLGRTHV